LWTPLIARGKGDVHSMWGLLYPLFFAEKRDERKQFYALAPLIAGWWGVDSTGGQAIPLMYYNRRDVGDNGQRSTAFNLGVLLAHYYNNPEDRDRVMALAWPLFHHSQLGEVG